MEHGRLDGFVSFHSGAKPWIVPLFRAKPSIGNGFLMSSVSASSALGPSAFRTRFPSHHSTNGERNYIRHNCQSLRSRWCLFESFRLQRYFRAIDSDHNVLQLFLPFQYVCRLSKIREDHRSHRSGSTK